MSARGRCVECPETVDPERSAFLCLDCREALCVAHALPHHERACESPTEDGDMPEDALPKRSLVYCADCGKVGREEAEDNICAPCQERREIESEVSRMEARREAWRDSGVD